MGQHAGEHRFPADRTGPTRDRAGVGDADAHGMCGHDAVPPRDAVAAGGDGVPRDGCASMRTGGRSRPPTKRELLGDHLHSLADVVSAFPAPNRPEVLTDDEIEHVAAAVRSLDIETSTMVVARLRASRARRPARGQR